MAFLVRDTDNVRQSFTSTGTTITLGATASNSRPFAGIASISNGDTLWIVARKGAEFSVGIFTYNSGGSFTQTTVFYSSNGNNPVSFSSGEGEIFCDAPSRLFDELNLKEISVASATTCDIGAVHGGKIVISGTTTITGLGTTIDKRRLVRFSGILTLTHDATSLILPGGKNITTAAGDTAIFMSDSSGNWRCYNYQRGGTGPILQVHGADIASASTVDLESATGDLVDVTGTTTITAITLSDGHERIVRFTGALTLTHGSSLLLPGAKSIATVAGDFAIFRGYAAGVVRCVDYIPVGSIPNRPSFIATKGGTDQTGIADVTFTQLTFGTVLSNVGGYFSSSAWTPPAGRVKIKLSTYGTGTFPVGNLAIGAIYKDGSALLQGRWPTTLNEFSSFVEVDDISNGSNAYTFYEYVDVSSGTATVSGLTSTTRASGEWIGP